MEHFLIIEDHQDVFENLERKILEKFPSAKISTASNCDFALDFIKSKKLSDPITLLILDLTFNNNNSDTQLKDGKSLLRALKDELMEIPTIIYSSHDELEHIYPVINNYAPKGYIIKTHNSNEDLLLCISKVLQGEYFYSQKVNDLLYNRVKYTCRLDTVDEQIIKLLPEIDFIKDWDGKIRTSPNEFMSYTSIKKRIDTICQELDVSNSKQLVLKLKQLGLL